ncbi:DNA cytosine methyltransferase [Mycoplasmopsis caviae]|uniref:Cytosine-specific methyltransferase n=1 Tax=Mycoplasmopsis caviae TaxID=55603 RepID=A0A3P8LAX3_9BACT|nr:DNA cytosine methyltransferase [Mycoplasmopsis caviae]UUD35112.1 DNA cytosine methyltransferase [Mycoplasmopsis caviae]VDR42071.1 Cytosine-specific DNA methyltransferase/Type II site-specific deoxyribonuclease [Mycoplasmopsis caviae]
MKYNVGSLFAGVGGFCLGFLQAKIKNASYKICFANEIDAYACQTYRTNFSHPLLEGDIHKFLNPELATNLKEKEYYESKRHILFENRIDVLNGGFPCQAFSIAGEKRGFDDERGNLFLQIIELINQMDKHKGKPRVLFLENVKNLLTHNGGNTYKTIKSKLEECGYKIVEKVLNTMDLTELPQNRERIYIIGFLNDEDFQRFTYFNEVDNLISKITKEQRVKQIESILDNEININDNYEFYYTKERYPKYFSDSPNDINLARDINESHQFYQCRRGMYLRKNKSNVCPTLTANMGTGGHNVPLILVKDGIRKITPTEAFKLQGFPVGESYKLPSEFKGRKYPNSMLYKQAGNAVSVDVIRILAEEILKVLDFNKFEYKLNNEDINLGALNQS